MPSFVLTVTRWGGDEPTELVLEAASADAAARLALAQGWQPLRVRAAQRAGAAAWAFWRPAGGRFGLRAVALFAEQLGELLLAGVVLEPALALLAHEQRGQTQPRPAGDAALRALAARLLRQVREGQSLSAALQAERQLPAAFAGVVQGAERAGLLGAGLAALAQTLQRQCETRERVRAALAYPLGLLLTAVAAVLFVLAVVIPEFSPLFAGEEQRLPGLTRAVVALSDLVAGRVWLILGGLALVGMGLAALWQTHAATRQLAWRHLRHVAPARHALSLDAAQIIRVLGALLVSGMEASHAMDLAAQSARFDDNRQAWLKAARLLREGASLSVVFEGLPHLLDSVVSMMAVGERSGTAGASALRAAQLQEADASRRVASLLALLNPLAVVGLGGLVALFIAAIMLGILSINQLALR